MFRQMDRHGSDSGQTLFKNEKESMLFCITKMDGILVGPHINGFFDFFQIYLEILPKDQVKVKKTYFIVRIP